MCKNFLLVILLGLPISANAHSLLTSSYPQSGEILTVPPTEIVMEFRTPTRLIKVDLTKSSDKKGKRLLGGFIGVEGESVPLSASTQMTTNKRQVIPLPSLEKGLYSLAWRALGKDGHVVKGVLTFNIKGS